MVMITRLTLNSPDICHFHEDLGESSNPHFYLQNGRDINPRGLNDMDPDKEWASRNTASCYLEDNLSLLVTVSGLPLPGGVPGELIQTTIRRKSMGKTRALPSPWKDGDNLSKEAFPSHLSPGQPHKGENLPGATQELRGGCQSGDKINKLKLLPIVFLLPVRTHSPPWTGCYLVIISNNNNNHLDNIGTDSY